VRVNLLPAAAIGVMATVSAVELWWHSAVEQHHLLSISAAVDHIVHHTKTSELFSPLVITQIMCLPLLQSPPAAAVPVQQQMTVTVSNTTQKRPSVCFVCHLLQPLV
jgi:hypothetical protein